MNDKVGIELINNTVMNVIQFCIANDDTRTLSSLGVSEQTIEQLLKSKVSYLGLGIIPIVQIDNKSTQLHLRACNDKYREQLQIKQLIQRDAPYNLMKANFGMTRKDYAQERIDLNMNKPLIGRPTDPNPESFPESLLSVLEEHILEKDSPPLIECPDLLLHQSFKHKIGIREILGLESVIKKEIL